MTIEAKIRISAIVDQAVKAIRQVKAEALGVDSATTGSGKPAFVNVTTGAENATKKVTKAKVAVDELANATTDPGKPAFVNVATGADDASKKVTKVKVAVDDLGSATDGQRGAKGADILAAFAGADKVANSLQQVKVEATGVAVAVSAVGKTPFADVTAGATAAAKQTKTTRIEAEALREANKAAAAEAKVQAEAAKKQALEKTVVADEAAKAQRKAAYEARLLAPQLTDIFVGLSTGQSPFTVLLQQGGQLKDVFGGVGNAAKAFFSIFTVGRVVLGGLAAAAGLFALEIVKGRSESDALNKTLALTGNIAGTSIGQLGTLAQQIATTRNTAIGDVRATLTQLVATGEFTQTSLGSAGRAAAALSKLTGQSSEESAKQFEGMSSNVVEFAAKSNRAYNFLTAEQFRYIQSLQTQGRTQEAMKVTLDALASTLEQRSVPAVGFLDRAWNGLKATLSGVLENLRAIGRDDTAEQQVSKLTKQLEVARAAQSRAAKPQDFNAFITGIQSQIDAVQRKATTEKQATEQRAADAQSEQQKILREGKGYQDALSAVSEAGAQKQLGQELANLDQRQAAVDLANAQGLLTARDYNVKINAIEEQRLQAQAATIQRQIKIAAGRKTEKPEDALANSAQVQQLQGQLAQIQGQISAAASKGRAIVAADAVDRAQKAQDEFVSIWQQAYDQVRSLAQQNGATQAQQISDPIARASAEAAVKVEDIRRQALELQRDLQLDISLKLDPGQREELKRQVEALAKEAKTTIDETTRTATFASLQQQFGELTQSISLQEQRFDLLVQQGALSVIEAERRKFQARSVALPQLEAILQAQQKLGTTTGEKNVIEAAAQDVLKLKDATTQFQRSARESGINSLGNALTEIGTGARNVKDGLLDMVASFGKSMLDLINKRLADQLFDQFITAGSRAGSSSSGGLLGSVFSLFGASKGSSAGGLITASVNHAGGVIGAGGLSRAVSPAVFDFAPRYHSGGIAGLKPGEVPAILQDGEEVLTAGDPRHVRNQSSSAVRDVNINVQVSGAQGSDVDQQAAANGLTQRMRAVVNEWAGEQSRQGGILAGRRA